MANIRQRPSGSWEIIIRRKILPKPIFASADTEAQALAYAARVEAQLDAGIIPRDLAEPTRQNIWTVSQWLDEYDKKFCPAPSDRPLLPIVQKAIGSRLISELDYSALEPWLEEMKSRRLTPGSIKKRVGALKRALDVAVVKRLLPSNPIAALPRNYSAYSKSDGPAVIDEKRDRRLEPGEEARIREALKDDPDMLRLFTLALETAMRLSEMYTLTGQQIDLDQRTIFLDKTKNGDKRQVPMSSVVMALFKAMGGIDDDQPVFPYFYDGDRRKTTMRLSYQWSQIAQKAECPDLHFHDLRHEATCRIYERTKLSDLEVAKITGHKSLTMLMRYANLRGSHLADALW